MADAKVYGILSAKGGVGKTTITANLGSILAREFKKKVLAVDANIEVPNLHLYLDMLGLPSSLQNVIKDEVSIAHSTYIHKSGLSVVPGSFLEEGVDVTRLKNIIGLVKGLYEIILLDSHPHVDKETRAVIESSDEVLIVTNPWIPIVTSCLLTIKLVNEVGTPIKGIILNKVGRSDEEMSAREVEDSLGLPILAKIPADINVYRGVEKRTPVVVEVPKSPASKEFRRLAKLF
ncbi:septum site-determining protein MinD [archaeon BMS3Bbin16]|nr:septum site-determining protein MinD [archaeon BMS3Bbin16]